MGARYRQLFSYIGFLTLGMGALLLVPAIVSLLIHGEACFAYCFAVPGVVTLIVGALVWQILKPAKRTPVTPPDAAFVITVTWVLGVVAGAAPFVLGRQLSPLNAVFEAMSGWTTTGLSMVNPDIVPRAFLLWRALMQFIGGAGFAVIMLAAVIGQLGPRMYEAEARSDYLLPHVRSTARMIMKIYAVYWAVGVVLFVICRMPFFDAVCHAMSGLATGGFSTRSGSIGSYGSIPIEAVAVLLMLIGTTNFATHHALLRSRGRRGWRDAELKLMAFLIIVAGGAIGYGLLRAGDASAAGSFRQAGFQVVSAVSGTGYSTVSLEGWSEFSLLMLIVLMIVEGGTCSTAGGIKLYRVVILGKSISWWIKKQFYPSSAVIHRSVMRRGERLEILDSHVHAVAAFVGIYIATYLAGVFVLLIDGFTLREAMFEFASALGTIGLSLGVTSPDMPLASKVAEILGMWLGRLEFLAIFHAVFKVIRDIRSW